MKLLNYLTATILISLCFLSIGDFFLWNSEQFDVGYDYVTFYPQSTDEQTMYQDIIESASNNNLKVFVVNREINSTYNAKMTIYSTAPTFEKLSIKHNLKEGYFKSLFMGNLTISHKPLSKIPNGSHFNQFYLIGNKNNMIKMKKELVNLYAGSFPKKSGSKNITPIYLLSLFGLVFLFLLLMTYTKISLLKKECLIRMVCGETLWSIFYKNSFLDCFIFTLIFIFSFIFSNILGYSLYLIVPIVFLFCLFLLITVLIHFPILWIDFSKHHGKNKAGNYVLKGTYIFKLGSLVLFLTLMSSLLPLIQDGKQFYSQRFFYKNYSNYSFIRLNTLGLEQTIDEQITNENFDSQLLLNLAQVHTKLEEELIDSLSIKQDAILSLNNIGSIDNVPLVYSTPTTLNYLKETITLKDFPTSDITLLIPTELKKQQLYYVKKISSYLNDSNFQLLPSIYYQSKANIIGIKNIEKPVSTYFSQPIIIYNKSNKLPEGLNLSSSIFRSSLFKITNKEWQTFLTQQQKVVDPAISYKLNAYSWFKQEWLIKKRSLMLASFLTLLAFFIEISLMIFLIRLEFKINSLELMLKELLGYSYIERHIYLFILPILIGITCLVILNFILPLVNTTFSSTLFISLFLFVSFEELFIFTLTKRYSSTNRIKILKGGHL